MKAEGIIICFYRTIDRKRLYEGGFFNNKVFLANN